MSALQVPVFFWAVLSVALLVLASGFFISQSTGLFGEAANTGKITGTIVLSDTGVDQSADSAEGVNLNSVSLPGTSCNAIVTSCYTKFRTWSYSSTPTPPVTPALALYSLLGTGPLDTDFSFTPVSPRKRIKGHIQEIPPGPAAAYFLVCSAYAYENISSDTYFLAYNDCTVRSGPKDDGFLICSSMEGFSHISVSYACTP